MNNFEYTNPIIHKRRSGTNDDHFIEISELHTINNNGQIVLTELPNEYERVQVEGNNITWKEVTRIDNTLKTDEFKVDYKNKIVTFNINHVGVQLLFSYLGTGLTYLPTSMIYTSENNGDVTETLKQLTDTTEQARQDVIETDNTVQTNESTRQSQEQTRETQETTRQSNETTRESEHDASMQELDEAVSTTKLNYLEPVATYNDISTTYPSPSVGDSTIAEDTRIRYRYDGANWVGIQQLDTGNSSVMGNYLMEFNTSTNTLDFKYIGG
ncbi:hypothetical protein [Aquibacillus saliphilus]|uniref:hypothetical protein n=1 Tax=Aquibacillus saliphilus TaxID=1909422 RepID=UPI001CF080EF|nr:hypothetical protein [Aquibacillus saliphilus]